MISLTHVSHISEASYLVMKLDTCSLVGSKILKHRNKLTKATFQEGIFQKGTPCGVASFQKPPGSWASTCLQGARDPRLFSGTTWPCPLTLTSLGPSHKVPPAT